MDSINELEDAWQRSVAMAGCQEANAGEEVPVTYLDVMCVETETSVREGFSGKTTKLHSQPTATSANRGVNARRRFHSQHAVQVDRLLDRLHDDNLRKQTSTILVPPISEGVCEFVQKACKQIVAQAWFQAFVAIVITANAITIGIETQLNDVDPVQDFVAGLETVFLFVYIVEISMKLMADQWRCFLDGWFWLDFVVVATVLVEHIMTVRSSPFMVLRQLRLLRVVHSFRSFRVAKSIWRLVCGLVNSFETMLSTALLLGFLIYVFGILGMALISRNERLKTDEKANKVVEEYFSSLGMTMITLTQFISMDGIASIYNPLIRANGVLGFYFLGLVAVVSICVMNLVTAVVVEGALEHAKQDREEEDKLEKIRAKQMIPEIMELFNSFDTDADGFVTLQEMQAFDKRGEVPMQILDRASVNSFADLFLILDVDGSGSIDKKEFESGLLNILLREVPLSSLQMLTMIRLLQSDMLNLQSDLRQLVQMQEAVISM